MYHILFSSADALLFDSYNAKNHDFMSDIELEKTSTFTADSHKSYHITFVVEFDLMTRVIASSWCEVEVIAHSIFDNFDFSGISSKGKSDEIKTDRRFRRTMIELVRSN